MDDRKKETRHHVIAAQPGWFVVEPVHEGDSITGLSKCPVVAWVVEVHFEGEDFDTGIASPVTADEWSDGEPILQRPDGRYVEACSGEYETDAEAIARFKEREDFKRRLQERRLAARDAILNYLRDHPQPVPADELLPATGKHKGALRDLAEAGRIVKSANGWALEDSGDAPTKLSQRETAEA